MDFAIIRDLDWARLAAFIDGEGCVSVRARNNNKSCTGGRVCTPEVSVANTDPRLMGWLQSTFGGNVRGFKNGPKQQKVCFKWEPKYSEIREVLTGCLPYFIIKREQAEIVIVLKTLLMSKTHRGAKVSEAVKDQREQMYDRIHVLNRRGRVVVPSITKVA
jgi:hypothetical protein